VLGNGCRNRVGATGVGTIVTGEREEGGRKREKERNLYPPHLWFHPTFQPWLWLCLCINPVFVLISLLLLVSIFVLHGGIRRLLPCFEHEVTYRIMSYCIVLCLENGVDGLQFTRSWLQRGAERLNARQTTTESAAATESVPSSSSEASASSSLPVSGTAANAVLNAAFLELIDWDDDHVFPEVTQYLLQYNTIQYSLFFTRCQLLRYFILFYCLQ